MPDDVPQPEQSANLEPNSVPPEQAVSPAPQGPEAPPEAPEAVPSTPILAPAETSVLSPETPVSVTAPEPIPVSVPAAQSIQPNPRSVLQKALDAIQFRKRAKLEKIVKYAEQKRSITNDQAEKLLRISDATATRYLSQLVKEGRLKRTGPAGNARYEPMSGSNGGN